MLIVVQSASNMHCNLIISHLYTIVFDTQSVRYRTKLYLFCIDYQKITVVSQFFCVLCVRGTTCFSDNVSG